MNFKLFLEASYRGNTGMMEMFKFYQVATPERKKYMKELIMAGQQEEAWKLLQKVTNSELEAA